MKRKEEPNHFAGQGSEESSETEDVFIPQFLSSGFYATNYIIFIYLFIYLFIFFSSSNTIQDQIRSNESINKIKENGRRKEEEEECETIGMMSGIEKKLDLRNQYGGSFRLCLF